MKVSSSPGAQNPSTLLSEILRAAEGAARRGDRRRAYQLSLEATQIAPREINAWLIRAETASSIEESAACLNQANALLPSGAEVKQKTYQLVQKLLNQDPFLLYLAESEHLYHIRSGEQLSLSVPKDRSVPEPYPAERPALLQTAYRWLWMALIGLLLAGLGAMVFAPLAAVAAIGLYLRHPSKSIRIKSLVVLILAGSLWLCGLLLCVILLVHSI